MSRALAQNKITPGPGALRTLATAIGSGVAVLVAGEAVWLGLIAAYSRYPTPFPWFVPAMAAVLAGAAAWMKWGRWPRFGAVARRDGVRLNAVPLKTFLLALAAGWSSFFAGASAYIAYRMVGGLGGEVPMAVPAGPRLAVIASLAMAALVAGVLEEIAVRGFLQGRLEKTFGVVPAILISGLVWALFHTNHSYFDAPVLDVAIWFAIFLMVSAMLGTIAHRTNSVLPGIVVHTVFDGTYFVAAGILQPKIAPLAFAESLAAPQVFAAVGAGLAVLAVVCWRAFYRATRAR